MRLHRLILCRSLSFKSYHRHASITIIDIVAYIVAQSYRWEIETSITEKSFSPSVAPLKGVANLFCRHNDRRHHHIHANVVSFSVLNEIFMGLVVLQQGTTARPVAMQQLRLATRGSNIRHPDTAGQQLFETLQHNRKVGSSNCSQQQAAKQCQWASRGHQRQGTLADSRGTVVAAGDNSSRGQQQQGTTAAGDNSSRGQQQQGQGTAAAADRSGRNSITGGRQQQQPKRKPQHLKCKNQRWCYVHHPPSIPKLQLLLFDLNAKLDRMYWKMTTERSEMSRLFLVVNPFSRHRSVICDLGGWWLQWGAENTL